MSAVNAPESPGQARLWDRTFDWYQAAGLCARCASQAAWGHQIGWTQVHAPCDRCTCVVSTFPLEQMGGWRSVPKQARTAREQPKK